MSRLANYCLSDNRNLDWAEKPRKASVFRTQPFKFNVTRAGSGARTVALMHPAAQLAVVALYQRMDAQILLACKKSRHSLRAPDRVAGTTYGPGDDPEELPIPTGSVDTVDALALRNRASSYFAYRDFSRLYRFYDSERFSELEGKWSHLLRSDVQRCFPSIYTHSIAWAETGRSTCKEFLQKTLSLGGLLDVVMRNANDGETNGIIVGPEISRIAAEIVLQQIDIDAEALLAARFGGLKFEFYRYVDDLFIFGDSEQDVRTVRGVYQDCLLAYNLTLNPAKDSLHARPFVTVESRSIQGVKAAVEEFLAAVESEITTAEGSETGPGRGPQSPARPHAAPDGPDVLGLYRRARASCSPELDGYQAVAKYVIGRILSRVNRICQRLDSVERSSSVSFRTYLRVLSRTSQAALHFLLLEPSVNGANSVARILLLSHRSLNKKSNSLAAEFSAIAGQSASATVLELVSRPSAGGRLRPVEALCMLQAMTEFAPDFVPRTALEALVDSDVPSAGYIELVSVLAVVGSDSRYGILKQKILDRADQLLLRIDGGQCRDAEAALLLLDLIACPYVPIDWKIAQLRRLRLVDSRPETSTAAWRAELMGSLSNPWFMAWGEKDLLKPLERRRLTFGY